MRANEFLSELFDPKKAVPFKPVSLTKFRAQLPDGRYLVTNFFPEDPTRKDWTEMPYKLEFSVNDDFDITGGGHVSTIFATVIEMVKYFSTGMGAKSLYFTAEEPSRAKMYDTLAKRISKQLGWHVVPHDELADNPAYRTEMSSGNFVFAIEKGEAPEHSQDAQRPQHSEFMPIFFIASMEHTDLPVIKVKSKKASKAIEWVLDNVPDYKNEDHNAINAYAVPPKDRKIIDKGTVQ